MISTTIKELKLAFMYMIGALVVAFLGAVIYNIVISKIREIIPMIIAWKERQFLENFEKSR